MSAPKTFQKAGAYLMPKLISYGMNFLLLPILTRVLTPEDFGAVALAWAVQNTVAGMAVMGISASVQRYYFSHRSDQARLGLLITTVGCFVYAALPVWTMVMLFWCAPLAKVVAGHEQYAQAFLGAFIAAYLNQIMGIYLMLYQSMERAKEYGFWVGLQTIVTALLTLIFVVFFKWGYMGLIYAAVGGALLVCLGAGFTFHREYRGRFSAKLLIDQIAYGVQIIPKSLTGFTNRFFDKYMLNSILSLSVVGVYNIAQSLVNAVNAGMQSVQSVFQPLWFKAVFDDHVKGRHEAGALFKIFNYYMVLVILLLEILASPLIHVLAPPPYHQAIPILMILCLAQTASLFGMFVGVQYAYSKKVFMVFPITVVGTLINVGFNIALIPQWGLAGAAWSLVASSYLSNLMLVLYGQRVYFVEYPWTSIVFSHAYVWGVCLFMLYGEHQMSILLMTVMKILCLGGYLFWGFKEGLIKNNGMARVMMFWKRTARQR